MSKKKWTDGWNYTSIVRREFRADHGGGPEEMPHRKARNGKKRLVCKRAKVRGDKCDFTKKVSKMMTKSVINEETGKRKWVPVEVMVTVCARCGRAEDRYRYYGSYIW